MQGSKIYVNYSQIKSLTGIKKPCIAYQQDAGHIQYVNSEQNPYYSLYELSDINGLMKRYKLRNKLSGTPEKAQLQIVYGNNQRRKTVDNDDMIKSNRSLQGGKR